MASDSDGQTAAVSACDLWKRYGDTEALRGVSFDVAAGQIFGLLGPNGAGKTTALECILGLRIPDRGSLRIAGLDLRTHSTRAKQLVGAQLQSAALQDRITPRQALDLFGSFYPRPFASGELLARFGLEAKADDAFASLSGGQRQRLFLALALVNRPALLVLDEPTAGLDPRARRELRALIGEVRREGRTVLLSTHDIEEAAQLCDRVAILDRGRIAAVAAPSELIAGSRASARIVLRTGPPLAAGAVRSLPGVTGAEFSDGSWIVETAAPMRVLPELLRRAREAGAALLDIELRRPSLEDVFLELTGRAWPGDDSQGAAQ